MGRPGPGTVCAIVILNRAPFLIVCCWCGLAEKLPAGAWQDALRAMPLRAAATLNRDNFMPLLLRAFQSNEVVKGLIFLPAVSDDFYLINRDQAKLNITAGNLLEAITALTNATAVRATFRHPFLLLHQDRDELVPNVIRNHKPAASSLKQEHHLPYVLWVDAHWQRVQPYLRECLKMKVLPEAQSEDAWHFARHNIAGWNLADSQVLAALSLAGKTTVSVEKNRILFQLRHTP